ncbi:SusC/RagA family TonB-linked outer membrane protein [Pedobacter chitinilyticus]|nr:SusC/RagA family TonB-linked outer membrane protein [Pedobacter chitinilyticus]
MKLIVLFMILSLKVSASLYAQVISLKVSNARLDQVMVEIKKQSGFSFWYDDNVLKGSKPVSVQLNNMPLTEALDKVFANQPITYSVTDKTIVLKAKPNSNTSSSVQQSIYGLVTDEFGQPLPGVTVREKGVANNPFITGQQGKFYIPVKSRESMLVFTYVGYETRELKASAFKDNPTNLTIVAMKPDVGKLDEVQVQAYGSGPKRTSTGNITTISKEEIEKNPSRNVLEIIKNQVPGLFIQQDNGGGAGNRINATIRGAQVFGYSEPLLIVDGAQFPLGKMPLDLYGDNNKNNNPLTSTPVTLGNLPRGYGNGLDFLDPSMIESIDILKDAAATSIYGSRGAYGVIIITTKKGKQGEPRLSINVNTRLDVRGYTPELLKTTDFINLQLESYRNSGQAIANDRSGFPFNGTWPATRYTNWNEYFAPQQPLNYNVNGSYSGGFNNFTYYLGGNFQNDRSVNIGPGGSKRGGANINLAFNQGGKFDAAISALYSSNADNAINVIGDVTLVPNAPPLLLADGSYNFVDYPSNVMADLSKLFQSNTNLFNTGLTLNYRPIKGLTIETRMGYNMTNSRQFAATPSTALDPNRGSLIQATTRSGVLSSGMRTITLDPNIAYVSKLGSLGSLSARAGFTLRDEYTYSTQIKGRNLLTDVVIDNPTFTKNPSDITASYNYEPGRYLGYFAQLNYNWNNKYILDLNARYDGSTKFGSGNRYGLFGSVSGAWIMSAEPWFAKALPFVAFGKLRASWGTQGGDGIANYQYVAMLAKNDDPVGQYLNQTSLFPVNLANPDLHWEKNTKSELGMELNFLKGNLTTSFSYYRNISSDQLQAMPLPTSTGFASVITNTPATIQNTGFEAVLGLLVATSKDFSWRANFNASIQRNKVTKLDQAMTNIFFNYEEGKSVNGKRVINFVGVNPQNGDLMYREANGIISNDLRPNAYTDLSNLLTGQIDRNRHSEWVDFSPKFFGALNNRFNYKAFSLGFTIGYTKRMMQNDIKANLMSMSQFRNMSTLALDRWQRPGQVSDIGKLTFAPANRAIDETSFGIEDGSVVRLQNADISWNLPQKTVEKLGLKNVSLQLTGSNLFVIWTPFSGTDPDVTRPGYVLTRTFQGALKVSF